MELNLINWFILLLSISSASPGVCGGGLEVRVQPVYTMDECEHYCKVEGRIYSHNTYVASGYRWIQHIGKADCKCFSECSCWDTSMKDYDMSVDPVAETCAEPGRSSYPLESCMRTMSDDYKTQRWVRYECDKSRGTVSQQFFDQEDDCKTYKHVRQSVDFHFGSCFSTFPEEHISPKSCHGETVQFEYCNPSKAPTGTPSSLPTYNPTSSTREPTWKPTTHEPSLRTLEPTMVVIQTRLPSAFPTSNDNTFVVPVPPQEEEAGGFAILWWYWLLLLLFGFCIGLCFVFCFCQPAKEGEEDMCLDSLDESNYKAYEDVSGEYTNDPHYMYYNDPQYSPVSSVYSSDPHRQYRPVDVYNSGDINSSPGTSIMSNSQEGRSAFDFGQTRSRSTRRPSDGKILTPREEKWRRDRNWIATLPVTPRMQGQSGKKRQPSTSSSGGDLKSNFLVPDTPSRYYYSGLKNKTIMSNELKTYLTRRNLAQFIPDLEKYDIQFAEDLLNLRPVDIDTFKEKPDAIDRNKLELLFLLGGAE